MSVPTRPTLTLGPIEAAALEQGYSDANVVWEYGAGGSTLLAAELGKQVCAVESDAAWAEMMQHWFAVHPAAVAPQILHVDIGPTREWGHPQTEASFRKWPDYPIKIWDQTQLPHPDVVLVDGRFRVACFLTTLYRITRPVTLFFDDYTGRPAYHEVEALVKPCQIYGRMARFDLVPTQLKPDRMRAYARALMQPA